MNLNEISEAGFTFLCRGVAPESYINPKKRTDPITTNNIWKHAFS